MDIKLKNVFKSYEDTPILNDLNLSIRNKSAVAIIGPSGAGKSTLLRLLSMIETPDSGEITVNQHFLSETDPHEYYKSIGFVFQSHSLFPHLTVLRNITLVLEEVHKYTKQESHQLAMTLLEQFDLAAHIHKLGFQLSGGQAQRVAIVRSLAIHPEVLFLDEPTSALDPVLTQEVLRTILKLRELNTHFVIVTHEILFAKKAADHIIFMENGKIVEEGDVSILEHPQTEALKRYLSNVFYW